MFYKDYKFIGARKPYDYPDDVSFKRTYHLQDNSELDTKVAPQFTDFSELAYGNTVQDNTDYSMNGFVKGDSGMGNISTNKKLMAIAGLVIVTYFILKGNIKQYSKKRAKGY